MKEISKPLTFTITLILAIITASIGNSYLFVVILCAGWLFYDARTRQDKNWLAWIIATLILSPLIIAVYLPQRKLRTKEKREGGYPWNLAKSFALLWTITLVSIACIGLGNVANTMPGMTNDFEIAGAGIGIALGLGLLFGLWLSIISPVLIIGLFLKKSTVEYGPIENQETGDKQ